jgi:hypothetical protein
MAIGSALAFAPDNPDNPGRAASMVSATAVQPDQKEIVVRLNSAVTEDTQVAWILLERPTWDPRVPAMSAG